MLGNINYLCAMHETILIVDFGSQYTQLIARRIRELNVYCEIHPWNKIPVDFTNLKGVILSGSPFSVRDETAPKPDLGILKGHAPLLTALDIGVMRVRVDKDWIPVVLMGGFAEVENDELTILVNGAEEGSKIDKDEAQKNLELMTSRFNEAETSKEKIEATQNLRKARARVQASTM